MEEKLRYAVGRAPHGARGLKWNVAGDYAVQEVSRPARGAWIEIVILLDPVI